MNSRRLKTMGKIEKEFIINSPLGEAYRAFVYEFGRWWPKQYTWSNEALQEIKIEPIKNGLCTEIGPYGFRCDWGRVVEIIENELIAIKWQIGPTRIPEPDPEKGSDLRFTFIEVDENATQLTLEHANFEKHGENHEEYLKTMDSKEGWDFILGKFYRYVMQ